MRRANTNKGTFCKTRHSRAVAFAGYVLLAGVPTLSSGKDGLPMFEQPMIAPLQCQETAKQYRYQDPASINLATIRGVIATASQNLKKGLAATVLHNGVGDISFIAKAGRCWWMMELPEEVSVSSVYLAFGRQIQSVGFRVKGASQALDDEGWDARPPLYDYNGHLPQTDDYYRWAACDFAATRVKFLRIEFYGQNGSEQQGKVAASSELVFHNIQVRGANNPVIGPAISSAQSASAGGRCTFSDASTSIPRDCPELIDDGEKGNRDFGDYNVKFYVKDGKPCNVIVKLKHRSKVSAAAFVTYVRENDKRPRDMNIYTSAEEIGENWTLQKELRDIAAGGYLETEFGNPVIAKRVRFEITRVWNTAIDKKRDASYGYLAEMYVYGVPGSPLPTDFSYTLQDAAMVGCQIIDDDGKPARTLDAVPMKPGTWLQEWDGLNDLGERLPAKSYRCRIVINPAVYTHVGNIGNNAVPSTVNQNPWIIESITIDREGNVFSANDWEEAGQNIRKWAGSDGRHVLHSMVSKTPPAGLPYGIAVDDKYVYCTAYAIGSYTSKIPFTQHDVRRYRVTDGSWAAFPGMTATNGHIAICKDPSKNLPEGTPAEDRVLMGRWPLRAIVAGREQLFVTDAFAGKIRSFNKETGEPGAAFDVKLPHALAIDAQERLWVGHQHGKVTVFDKEGRLLKQVLGDLGHCGTLAFGPGNRLYVADTVARQVKIYEVDFTKLRTTFLKTFGQPAKRGDYAPGQFYSLSGFGVDAQGNMFASDMFPLAGARLTKFSAAGTVLWDQYGSEFCSIGNYSPERPDDIISQYLNRYHVDKSTGEIAFRGFVYDGDERFLQFGKRGGPTRFLKLGKSEFLFQGYGDGLRVFRHEKGLYRLAAMFGMKEPMPDGRYWNDLPGTAEEKLQKYPIGLWSWHDANGNGLVDETEITWAIKPKPGEKPRIAHFGINVDDQGNALFCEHHKRNVMEVPVSGFDALGNPIYGTDAMKEVVPPEKMPVDKKRIMSLPLMAVRAEDGTIYVQGRSEVYPKPPEADAGWMAGWVLARYDRNGTMLWHRPLPEACPGMDRVPGGGVMLAAISFKWEKGGGPIYHYTPDGMLIGMAKLSPRFLNPVGAGPDNVGSLCVSRDPRDGQLDLFAEDCLGNRFYWYRVDDRKPLKIVTGTLGTKAGQQ